MDRKGFTLIELVMILVLIGIIATVVVPRLGNMPAMNAAAFVGKLRADIRYAQDLAMTRGKRTRVNFAALVYTVAQDTNAAGNCGGPFIAVSDPAGGGLLAVNLNTGNYAGITLTLPAMTCLEYSSIGQPYDCTGLGNICSAVSSGMTVTVNSPSGVAGSITVISQTGAVN